MTPVNDTTVLQDTIGIIVVHAVDVTADGSMFYTTGTLETTAGMTALCLIGMTSPDR